MGDLGQVKPLYVTAVPLGNGRTDTVDRFQVVYDGGLPSKQLTGLGHALQERLGTMFPTESITCNGVASDYGAMVVVNGLDLNGDEGVEILSNETSPLYKGAASGEVQQITLDGETSSCAIVWLKLFGGTVDLPPKGHEFTGVSNWEPKSPLPKLHLVFEVHSGDRDEITTAITGACTAMHIHLLDLHFSEGFVSPLSLALRR
jgi:hypothetical protein